MDFPREGKSFIRSLAPMLHRAASRLSGEAETEGLPDFAWEGWRACAVMGETARADCRVGRQIPGVHGRRGLCWAGLWEIIESTGRVARATGDTIGISGPLANHALALYITSFLRRNFGISSKIFPVPPKKWFRCAVDDLDCSIERRYFVFTVEFPLVSRFAAPRYVGCCFYGSSHRGGACSAVCASRGK